MSICEVKDLCKVYPAFELKDVNFSLNSGRITGFIGRNGAGKTTTIKSMLGLVHPTSGEVYYFGKPFSGNEREIKQRIGYSTGSTTFFPRRKIKDILDVTKTFYDTWDDGKCREYMQLFALDGNKCPAELSEGMKVKFNLLLALSHKAEILILDEPTSGLDPFSRDELMEIFTDLRSHGMAILFSTHITSDLEKCADDIVYIQKGSIVADCRMADFTSNFGKDNETAEQVMLRMEREARNI